MNYYDPTSAFFNGITPIPKGITPYTESYEHRRVLQHTITMTVTPRIQHQTAPTVNATGDMLETTPDGVNYGLEQGSYIGTIMWRIEREIEGSTISWQGKTYGEAIGFPGNYYRHLYVGKTSRMKLSFSNFEKYRYFFDDLQNNPGWVDSDATSQQLLPASRQPYVRAYIFSDIDPNLRGAIQLTIGTFCTWKIHWHKLDNTLLPGLWGVAENNNTLQRLEARTNELRSIARMERLRLGDNGRSTDQLGTESKRRKANHDQGSDEIITMGGQGKSSFLSGARKALGSKKTKANEG